MTGQPHSQTIETLVALLIIVTVVGVVVHRLRLPYTVSLVLVGLGLKALGVVPQLQLTQDLLLIVFLPALLFEAAIHFPAYELRQFAPTIATLAVPGVLLTAITTALVLQFEFSTIGLTTPFTFSHFLLFGTIIAATDPISVITLFRQLGVNRRLSLLIEGESLFNDGTAIVAYSVVLGAITSGSFSVSQGIVQFGIVAMGGIFVGAVFGLFASLVITFTEDHLISIALTTVTAYGTYLVAEELHASGILATVVAGLFVGNIGQKKNMSASTRIAVASFWEFLSFFISSIVFLLIGLEVHLSLLTENYGLILLAFGAVLASRAVSVFLPIPILNRIGQPMSLKSATVVWWAGLRGSLSMVLVLALPTSMEVRDPLIAMTFGVVLLSVVVQGITMGPVIKWLGFIAPKSEAATFLARKVARLKAIKSQMEALGQLSPQDLPGVKDLNSNLLAERSEIMKALEEKKQDPEFGHAVALRMAKIQQQLSEVAKLSYRKSLEADLLDENDAKDLTSKLDESSLT